jgi:predicted permease
VQEDAPPAPTRATFLSTNAQQWDVLVDNSAVCSTPCSGPLFPLQFVVLQSHEPDPVLLEIGRLPPGDFVVTGKPRQNGMYAGGIVATTLGGMALVTGITLTAVGLAKDKDGMTTAGLITGGVGLLTVPAGIYLIVKALPSARVDRGAAVAGLAGGIGGTF